METEYDLSKEIAYVTKRAIAEGSAALYLEKEFENKISINKLVSDVIHSHDDFYTKVEEEDFNNFTSTDEENFIVEATGYSNEIVENLLWFYECYQMADNCVQYLGKCEECGHGTVYVREDESEKYGLLIECDKCKRKFPYPYDGIDEDFDLSEL